MEAIIRDDVSGKRVRHEVSETATAGELLQEACTLFGREVLDSALEVDGAVVCTRVVGGVSGGEVSVGSLGVHSDSSLVLCRSRDRVLAVVAGWENFWYHPEEDSLPEWAWDDEVVALAAVAVRSDALKFVSERLRNSDSFMRDAVARNGGVLEYASVELRADRQLVLAAVTKTSCSRNDCWAKYSLVPFVSEALRADKEVVLTAVANSGRSLEFASENLKADKEIVLTAVANSGCSLEFVCKTLQADKQVVLTAVASSGRSLKFASENLQADKQVVLTAVASSGRSLKFASENLQADKQVVLTAVARSGEAFAYASAELQADKQVVLTAVASSGRSLKFASENLQADKQVVLTAVARSGEAFAYASAELQADKQVVLTAAAQERYSLGEEPQEGDTEILAVARTIAACASEY